MVSEKTVWTRQIRSGLLGKAIGGTLGAPFEGSERVRDLTFYDPVPEGMVPNDDLDLQIMYAVELDKMATPRIDREVLGRIFQEHNRFCFDEYNGVSFEATDLAPGSGGTPPGRSYMMYHIYSREDVYIEATSKGFSNMDVALDNMYAISLNRHTSLPMYDSVEDETSIVTTDSIISYLQDEEAYSKIILFHNWGDLNSGVLYK